MSENDESPTGSASDIDAGRERGWRGRWLLRSTALLTLGVVVAATIGATGSAQVLSPDARVIATPAAEPTQRNTPPPPETAEERHERVAEQKPMLAPRAPKSRDTVCVNGEFTTLAVVYDSIFEGVLPALPPQMRSAAESARAAAHRDMRRLHISTLAISNHPMTQGADAMDPAVRYRDPISQWIVGQLLTVRDGRQGDAIPVGDITVTQAVETVWLYLSLTVFGPLGVASGLIPALGSPLTGTALESLAGYVSYGAILSLGISGGTLALQYVYAGIAAALINGCVAEVTDEERQRAGRPSDTVTYDIPVPAIVQGVADRLALADTDTCAPIGSFTLERVVQRTSEHVQSTMREPAAKQRIQGETRKILSGLRVTRVPHHLIPADPYDYTPAENAISIIGRVIPYVGGAPLGIALGLSHNRDQGADFGEMIPLADLTVTKSLTAAYYSYSLALHLTSLVGGLLEPNLLAGLGLGNLPVTPLRVANAVAYLPLTYGLVVYHNVLRSMCLREDDSTGTGLGAETDRRDNIPVRRTEDQERPTR